MDFSLLCIYSSNKKIHLGTMYVMYNENISYKMVKKLASFFLSQKASNKYIIRVKEDNSDILSCPVLQ